MGARRAGVGADAPCCPTQGEPRGQIVNTGAKRGIVNPVQKRSARGTSTEFRFRLGSAEARVDEPFGFESAWVQHDSKKWLLVAAVCRWLSRRRSYTLRRLPTAGQQSCSDALGCRCNIRACFALPTVLLTQPSVHNSSAKTKHAYSTVAPHHSGAALVLPFPLLGPQARGD